MVTTVSRPWPRRLRHTASSAAAQHLTAASSAQLLSSSFKETTAREQKKMIIMDEKMPPPPPYRRRQSSQVKTSTTFSGLPAHIILQIVYWTCPSGISLEDRRLSLFWISTNLRYVSRDVWIASMHILRSAYLPQYVRHVIKPFTTDPFPSAVSASPADHTLSPIISSQRETSVLDLFIRVKTRQDVRSDESDLYLDNEDEQYRDLFNLMQPRARTEDLVCKYGMRAGLVTATSNPPLPSTVNPSIARVSPSAISVTWGHRKLTLAIINLPELPRDRWSSQGQSKRLFIEVQRERADTLEDLAKRLVREWARIIR